MIALVNVALFFQSRYFSDPQPLAAGPVCASARK